MQSWTHVGLATDLPANTDVFPAPIFHRDKLQPEKATEHKINTPGLPHLTGRTSRTAGSLTILSRLDKRKLFFSGALTKTPQ